MALWGVLWGSCNKRDGKIEYLIYDDGVPTLFPTRRKAREWIIVHYGYIRDRADLRAEPHGWRMPIAVKVNVVMRDGGVR